MKFSKSSIRKTNAVYILSLTMSHMGTPEPFLLPFTSEALELLEQPTSKAKKFTYTPYPTFYFFLINQACAVVSEKSCLWNSTGVTWYFSHNCPPPTWSSTAIVLKQSSAPVSIRLVQPFSSPHALHHRQCSRLLSFQLSSSHPSRFFSITLQPCSTAPSIREYLCTAHSISSLLNIMLH